MSAELSVKIVAITPQTVLKINDLLTGYDRTKNEHSQYLIKSIRNDLFTIIKMAVNGKILLTNERNTLEVTFKEMIERDFRVTVDKSNDKHTWPKTVNEAIEKILAQYTTNDITAIKKMTWNEFNAKYNNFDQLGLYIRNYFGLLRGNFDLALDCQIDDPNADNVSFTIVYPLWEKIKDEMK